MPREGSGATLIVGASQAGLQLAAKLRELGDEDPITLVGAEVHPPYQRPPLSKEFLAGSAEQDILPFRAPSYYVDARIDLVCGETVTGLELDPSGPPGSGVATTSTGRRIAFDRLALTVGAAPRRLPVPGVELGGVCYLRDLDDAAELRSRMSEASRVVVVGGGFIGLEAAAVARGYDKDVTVVEFLDRLLARAVAPVVSEFYREAHERRGTRVLLSTGVTGFSGKDGAVGAVELADGSELPADLVVIGVGVVPRTELAEQLGLECDGGIVVDERARTSNPAIVAAGDCTVQPHPITGEGRVRLESVPNAVAQANVAAAALRDDETTAGAVPAVPWFWSNQGDLKLQIAGLSAGYDSYVLRGDPDTEKFSVLYYSGDQLLAVDAVNTPADYLVVRKALSTGGHIPADKAGDSDVPLKTLLVAGAASAG